ncbi:ABC transporter ATP-binding protein [Dolosigranulum pigrum]|uniref:ABC transporter ATP-binding protein n=1 Tax=Dolosigranulum pigrum TaxID=29394 RepID=A0A516GI38_9LACT|nr:ABC transporter ATP-binding protein [Dolosigranulum pigrum]QDO91192.1 ABC transporter ATP-binding protein [Dolosigranulum pigrum]QTJ32614.1 ABC transporter ATP-binding protein [Dolosigranulum pigrum]
MAVEKSLLEINNLSVGFRYGDKFYNAVDDVSLTLEKDEILAIVGESGSGKSTLATAIIGLHDPLNTRVEGEIIYQDYDLNKLNEKLYNKIRGNDIGMIFQDPLGTLNPVMTVYKQIAESLLYHTDMNEEQRKARVLELLNQVGIPRPEQVMKAYPHELSGGMRQRVVIAIALANKPPILIADEPTTALDVTIQAQILDLMNDIQEETHNGIILITHDLGVVAETADRVAVMYAGQIVEEAPVEELFANPKHPYTRSLLKSVPHELADGEELHVIHGTVPSLQNLPRKGDRFKDRIPWMDDDAFDDDPQLTEISPGHKVRGNSWKHFYFPGEENKA